MVVVTTDFISGENIKTITMVQGSMVQSKNIGRDILSGLKNIVGGELKAYTEMLNEARDMAMARMIEQAKSLGADGIVGVKIATSAVTQGASEILVYGTAVKIV